MTTLGPDDDRRAARLEGLDMHGSRMDRVDLRGARLREVDLRDVVVRAADVGGMEIDAPRLPYGEGTLTVNGVDVGPLVEAELERRFPGRSLRRAHDDPDELRAAWAAVCRAWASAMARVEGMPSGTVDVQVDGEWSFQQTLRHLVMATDTWLGRAVLGREQPYHPLGLPHEDFARDGYDTSVFSDREPAWGEVRAVRAERQQMVTDLVAGATREDLAAVRPNPWNPDLVETVGTCLRVIVGEEWEHLRFALRDLEVIEAECS